MLLSPNHLPSQERTSRPAAGSAAILPHWRQRLTLRSAAILGGVACAAALVAVALIGWRSEPTAPVGHVATAPAGSGRPAAVGIAPTANLPPSVFAPADRVALRAELLGDRPSGFAPAPVPTVIARAAPPSTGAGHGVNPAPEPLAIPPLATPPVGRAIAPEGRQGAGPAPTALIPLPTPPTPLPTTAPTPAPPPVPGRPAATAPPQPPGRDVPDAAQAARPSPQVAEAQRLLTRLGHRVGAADGVAGARTQQAIRDYQRRRKLPADGTVTPQLLAQLREDAGRVARQPSPAAPSRAPAADAPSSEPSPSWLGSIAGGFQRLIGKQINSVTRPAELRAYCRANPETWIFDEGKNAFTWCGNVVAGSRG